MTSPPVPLVTGAGSATGIGFATARQIGAAGMCVVLAATTDRIDATRSTRNTTGPG